MPLSYFTPVFLRLEEIVAFMPPMGASSKEGVITQSGQEVNEFSSEAKLSLSGNRV